MSIDFLNFYLPFYHNHPTPPYFFFSIVMILFHIFHISKIYISGKWLVPPKPSPNKSWCQMFSEKLPHHFTISYWKNNRPFLCFLFFIIGVNIISMIQRAYYFKDFSMLNGFTPNVFYLVSRACGNV